MNRIEPNLLLAVTTAIALALMLMTTSLYGPPDGAIRYPVMAVVCSGLYVMLNGVVLRRMKRTTPPMIHEDAPATAVWASLFPLAIILGAGIPLFFPANDYGLMIIIGSIFLGVTIESALKARNR
ncbi:hypothetical protein [Brevundimonas sp.]|uniref:hypothetical protein n=1 Tax=Brevundimonas sp. TaxID=1871086 RepID=UPI002ABA1DBC|nr:hypothetical protein [Brevundimonas sp.]MDZ4364097.1 hypothetical protein [Brevundimonas sp.]